MLFTAGLMNFEIFLLKVLRLGEFQISGTNLLHAIFIKIRNIVCFPSRVRSVFLPNYILWAL